MRPAHRPLRRLAFTVLASLAGLFLLEGAARVGIRVALELTLPDQVVDWITTQQMVFDPELGWRPVVDLDDIRGSAFKVDEVHSSRAPRGPGERIGFAFGDSQTHGAGLAERHAWPEVAEAELRARGHDVRIVNLGSSGYRSSQVLRLLEVSVLPLEPDFLVVDCMARDSRPLERRAPTALDPVRAALFQSRLYRLLLLGTAAAQGRPLGPSRTIEMYQEDVQGKGEQPGNHQAIADLAAAHGIPLIWVDYPFLRGEIQSRAPPSLLPAGALVVPATQALLDTGKPPYDLFFESNHLTIEGSQVVGRAVADTVEATLAALP